MSRRRRALSFALSLALSASLALVAVPGAAAQQAECPDLLPLSSVTVGMTGTGHTVARGTTPTSFTAEVVGILEDGIGPGRDMIIIEASGAVIDQAGGIWAGMSGSPIYVNGRLIGVLAFGFSGSSRIAGLTPAADLVQVLDGGGPVSSASSSTAWSGAESRAHSVEGRTGTFSRLALPLAVSGLSPDRLELLGSRMAAQGLDVIPVAAGGVSTSQTATTVEAGGNFAGALSTGDITAAGIGTTSYVCDGEVAAFGHPFFFGGDVTIAAAGADALTIIEDPVFGPYKLANLTDLVGTVTQDRLAGIGGPLGAVPAGTPITSDITSVATGVSRAGTTEVFDPRFVADLAFSHLLGNFDSIFDQIGPGNATMTFDITGRRADGTAFSLRRANSFSSTFDVAFEAVDELAIYVFLLGNSGVEETTIRAVDVVADIDPQVRRYTIASATVSVDGGPPVSIAPPTGAEFVPELLIGPGSEVAIEATLTPFGSSDRVVESMTLTVPPDAPSGFGTFSLRGGPGSQLFDFFGCQFEPSLCPGSFDDLLAALTELPRRDDLVAEVRIFPEGIPGIGDGVIVEEPVTAPDVAPGVDPVQEEPGGGVVVGDEPVPGGDQVVARAVARLDRPVTGELFAPVFPPFGPSEPREVAVQRAAGPDRIATAIALSELIYPDRGLTDTVVVAGEAAEADALVSAPLAAVRGAPVLLTPRDRLADAVADEIGRLGATRAVIVGGTAAVSPAVEDALTTAGLVVQRIAGADRTATAAAVAAGIPGPHAYVVGADASVDAAAVAGLAALQRAPILFATDGLPPATADALGPRRGVTIVGGTRAVPEPVAEQLRARGLSVDRLAGSDRYGTSAAVVLRTLEIGASPFVLFTATGRGVADALVAGAAAAAVGAPLLLVDGQDPGGAAATRELLGQLAGAVGLVVTVGGPAAVVPAVVDGIVQLLGAGGGSAPPPPPPAG